MHPVIQQQLNLQLSPADVLREVLKHFSEKEIQRINNLVGRGRSVEINTYSELTDKYKTLSMLKHRISKADTVDYTRLNSLENQITELRKYRQLILKNMGS